MLFYERIEKKADEEAGPSRDVVSEGRESSGKKDPSFECAVSGSSVPPVMGELAPELEHWIWQDNINFIQDMMLFDHTYFK